MQLKLQRLYMDDTCTIGELTDGADLNLFTLELPVRDGLPGSAIPSGTFPLANRISPRFGRNVPHVDAIPNRSNILIHWGNTATDTEGCILVGMSYERDNPHFIGRSREAFDKLYGEFTAALVRGESVTLTVQGGQPTNAADVRAAATGESE